MNREGCHIGRRTGRSGFTLVEAVISTLIVGVMFVAALSTVGASRVSQQKTSVTSQAHLLAEALLAEVLQQDYQEPDDTPVFGPESGESQATRADFDDVDDYHRWSASPPLARDGTELTDTDRWERTVYIQWVHARMPALAMPSETGVKHITVTVRYDGVPRASLVALKSANTSGGL